ELVAGQRRGRAFLAWNHHAQGEVGELLQEIRVPAQERGHLVRAELFPRVVGRDVVHVANSPSNTNAAGPAIVIAPVASCQPMSRLPPGSPTDSSRPTRPRRIRIAAAAQAPLPQASVSPTPRSNTRRRIASRD